VKLSWNEAEEAWVSTEPESRFRVAIDSSGFEIGDYDDGEGVFVSHRLDRELALQVGRMLVEWAETGEIAP
jgi:hypothetical protein